MPAHYFLIIGHPPRSNKKKTQKKVRKLAGNKHIFQFLFPEAKPLVIYDFSLKSNKKTQMCNKGKCEESPSRNTCINISGIGIKSQAFELTPNTQRTEKIQISKHARKCSRIVSNKIQQISNNSRPLSASTHQSTCTRKRFWLKFLRGKLTQAENQNMIPRQSGYHFDDQKNDAEHTITNHQNRNSVEITSNNNIKCLIQNSETEKLMVQKQSTQIFKNKSKLVLSPQAEDFRNESLSKNCSNQKCRWSKFQDENNEDINNLNFGELRKFIKSDRYQKINCKPSK